MRRILASYFTFRFGFLLMPSLLHKFVSQAWLYHQIYANGNMQRQCTDSLILSKWLLLFGEPWMLGLHPGQWFPFFDQRSFPQRVNTGTITLLALKSVKKSGEESTPLPPPKNKKQKLSSLVKLVNNPKPAEFVFFF